MTAQIAQVGWVAYCEECDWESSDYEFKNDAESAAGYHNEVKHCEL